MIDFYCSKVKLGIEVDGEVHFTKEAQNRDENRSGFLSDFGIDVIRFRNDEVFNNLEKVISTIERKLKELEKSKS